MFCLKGAEDDEEEDNASKIATLRRPLPPTANINCRLAWQLQRKSGDRGEEAELVSPLAQFKFEIEVCSIDRREVCLLHMFHKEHREFLPTTYLFS